MEEKYLYMISLNKKRIALLGISFLALFSLFFVMGMAIGIQTADLAVEDEGIRELSSGKVLDAAMVSTTKGMIKDQSPELINREVEFERNPSVSSSDLLSFDEKKVVTLPPLRKIEQRKPAFPIPDPPSSPSRQVRKASLAATKAPKAATPTRVSKSSNKSKRYYIQLFLSREKKKADEILHELLKRKYKGYIREVRHQGNIHYVVRVGLYSDTNKLRKDLNLLKYKGGYKDAYVKPVHS